MCYAVWRSCLGGCDLHAVLFSRGCESQRLNGGRIVMGQTPPVGQLKLHVDANGR